MRYLLATIVFLLTATNCFANADEEIVKAMARQTTLTPEEIRRDYNACDSGVTRQMKTCGSYLFFEQDVRLNRIYEQAIAKAKERGYETLLVKAQRAWLAYRDAACVFEGVMGARGGTAEGLYVLSCKRSLTQERADRLAELVKDF